MLAGRQIQSVVKSSSLDVLRRGFCGMLPQVWSTVPQHIIWNGYNYGWQRISTCCRRGIIGTHPFPSKLQGKKSKVDGVIDALDSKQFITDMSRDLVFRG